MTSSNGAHSDTRIIGQHPLMQRIHELIDKVAATDATVLITGESGTGKELIAREIHGRSPRASGPFIPVNCGAIPQELQESELFGHEKGAFTGAIRDRPGMFRLANGGTIFLDEVGETSAVLQVKLLRVLQDSQIRPVGGEQPVHVDVRVLAATNKNLAEEVRQGRFREDLFYRLHVIPIHVPPLRERRSDIPRLVEHFLDKLNGSHRDSPVEMSEEAMVQMWEYDWPGNVRELENLLERLVILTEGNEIDVDSLPPNIRSYVSDRHVPQANLGESGFDLSRVVEAYENRLIDQALRQTEGNKQAAARLLGVKRTTLVAKLRRRQKSGTPSPSQVISDD